jgi:hypothetical protein
VALLYALMRWLAVRWQKRREWLLGMFAPQMVVVLLCYWAAGLMLGYSLILYAFAAQIRPQVDPGSALYMGAMSLLSLGFGDFIPVGAAARTVVVLEAATGLALIAVVITFLYSLFGEFQRREVLVVTLSSRAGAPPSGLALLQTYANEGMLEQLGAVFLDWETWSAQVLDSHLSYPILAFFRSTHDSVSWLSALGAVLDAATLVLTTVEGVPQGPARLMRRGGVHLVADLAQYFHLDEAPVPFVEEAEFHQACEHLQAAGYRLVERDAAWAAFARSRSEYAGALNAMARRLATPPAQWIGDRSPRGRHRGRGVRR